MTQLINLDNLKKLADNLVEVSDKCLCFQYYQERIFGETEEMKLVEFDEDVSLSLWDFIFSDRFSTFDNTVEGCVNRINHLLDIGIDDLTDRFSQYHSYDNSAFECVEMYVEMYGLKGNSGI